MRRLSLLVLLGAVLAACGARAEETATERRTGSPRLFLAGDGELWVVDVAAERVRRLRVPQLKPGDPPRRIVPRGGGMALWGYDVWRLDPEDPESAPRRIVRDGWFFIPSADAGRLWVSLRDPSSPPTVNALRAVREIDLSGRVTVEDTRPPGGAWPVLALRGGLLFDLRSRWVLWDPVSLREVGRWSQRALGVPGAAHGDVIASCHDPCTTMRLTNTRTDVQHRVPAPAGWVMRVGVSSFSPDGRTLAVPVGRSAREEGTTRLALVDVSRREARIVPGSKVPGGYTLARWSRTGAFVFLTGGQGARDRAVVAYEMGSASARRLRVRVGAFSDAAAW